MTREVLERSRCDRPITPNFARTQNETTVMQVQSKRQLK